MNYKYHHRMEYFSGPKWDFMVENTKTFDQWLLTLQYMQEDQTVNVGRLIIIHMFTTDVIEYTKKQSEEGILESEKIQKYYHEKILDITRG